VTAGANWQFRHGVIGVEADFNWSNFNNQQVQTGTNLLLVNQSQWHNFSTVRVRAGMAIDNVMMYATGGAAIVDTHYLAFTAGSGGLLVTDSGTKIGLAVGGGAEYAITNNLSAKLEYLFIAIPNSGTDLLTNGCTPGACPVTWKSSANVLRAGLNYRFNWFAAAR
jgi:outer membrane immunogenic protein